MGGDDKSGSSVQALLRIIAVLSGAKLGISAADTQSGMAATAGASAAVLLSVTLVLVAGILRIVGRRAAAKSTLLVLLALWVGFVGAPLLAAIIATAKLRLAG